MEPNYVCRRRFVQTWAFDLFVSQKPPGDVDLPLPVAVPSTTCFGRGEDRLGALTDDILLSVLGRVDLATAARTSALSRRWRSLPWLLPELKLHVRDFLPAPCPDYPVAAALRIYFYFQIPAQHIDEAMASLTRAARSFLRIKRSSRVSRMSLEIYLVGNYSHDIGQLVRDAIDNGMVKEQDLTIADDKDYECKGADMLQKARDVDGFFSAYPNILPCLTRLQLYNLRFAEGDMLHPWFSISASEKFQHQPKSLKFSEFQFPFQPNDRNIHLNSIKILKILKNILKNIGIVVLY